MDYGRIIRRALEVTWRHKVLWAFGIAAALFSGGYRGSGTNAILYRLDDADPGRWGRQLPFAPNLQAAIPGILAVIGLLFLVSVVLAIVGIIVRYTSLGALIGGVDEVERSERATFRSALRTGWRNLLRLLAIDLIIGVAMFAVILGIVLLAVAGVLLAALPAVALARSGGAGANVLAVLWGIGVGLVMLLAIVAVSVVVSAISTLVRELSFRANVLERRGIFDSIGTAFGLIRANFKEVLLVWLILMAIDLGLSVLAIPLLVIGVIGLVGPAVAAYSLSESVAVVLLVLIPLALLVALLSAFVGGLVFTFRSAVWTLAYREWRPEHLALEAV